MPVSAAAQRDFPISLRGRFVSTETEAAFRLDNQPQEKLQAILALVLGAEIAWNLHFLQRRQFAALRRETGLRAGLEAALSEVQTLQGILPICAHCKAVRNDQGFWQQVEVYFREHSGAQFTHGICPKCMQEHFGEYKSAK